MMYVCMYVCITYSRKKTKKKEKPFLFKIFWRLPLSIHYYQQVIFVSCYILK